MLGEQRNKTAAFKGPCGCFVEEADSQGECGGQEPQQEAVLRVQAANDLGVQAWREVKLERWMPGPGQDWRSQGRAEGLWVFGALPQFSHQ